MDNLCSSQVVDAVDDVNGTVSICQNTDIVLPNCIDLDWAQIIYAINYRRILFIHRSHTWSSFHIESSDNGIKYNDYSSEELAHRFLQRVLPNIFEYELTEDEIHLLNLFDLHPNFERTSTGFKTVEHTERLLFPSDEAAITTLIKSEVLPNEPKCVGLDAHLNDQIITLGTSEESPIFRKFCFNEENAALLSVALCPDEELPKCELLTIEEITKRSKAAKGQFEDNASQPENVNISLDDLLKKIHTISELKEAITKLVNSSFCRQTVAN